MRARPNNNIRGKAIIILLALFVCNIFNYGQTAGTIEKFQLSDKSAITVTLSNGTLTFSGNGEMEDFFYQRPPWYESRGKVNHIIINKGITSIGAYSFEWFQNLLSISLPSTITKIGEGAFKGCVKIEEIKIPHSVISIGQYAFSNCNNLTSINIPEGITSIEDYTFLACNKLKSIDLPGSVKIIGLYAFQNCKFSSFIIPEGVKSIKKGAFNFCMDLTEVKIPSSVTSIDNDIFSFSKLQSISVDGDNPRYFSVNNRALCSNDTLLFVLGNGDFTIPKGITTIGKRAFNKINLSEKNEIQSVTIPESVTNIEDAAFFHCTNLNTIILPPNLVAIDSNAFSNCFQLKTVNIPKSVKFIGKNAFKNTAIKSIEFPNSDIHIGNSCFWGCNNLESIIFNEKSKYIFSDGLLYIADTLIICVRSKEGSVTIPKNIKHIAESAFQGCENITSVSIPDGVTHIYDYAFGDCRRLSSVIIPNSVIYLGNNAFQNNISLDSITLPDNLKEIKFGTFQLCYYLSSINLPKNLRKIEDYAFYSTNLDSIVFPDSLDIILNNAFLSCEKLTSITIPKNISHIGYNVFDKCPKLKTIVNFNPVPQNIDKDAFGKLISDSIDLSKITLYVEESSISTYQNTDVWENFNIQPLWKNSEMLSTSVNVVDEIIKQAKILHKQNESGKAISLLLQNKEIFDKAKSLSSLYGHLSWLYIFDKNFKKAEEAANMALSNDNNQSWIKLNLAHALLLQNQYDSANKLYESLSTKTYSKKQTYSSLISEQLEEIENAGLLSSQTLSQIEKTRAELLNLHEIEKKVAEARRLFIEIKLYECINVLAPLQNRFTEKNPYSTEALFLLGTSNYLYGQSLINGNKNFSQSDKCFLQLKTILDNKEKKYSKEYYTVLYCLGKLYSEPRFENKDIGSSIEYYLKAKETGEQIWGHKDKIVLMMNEYDTFEESLGLKNYNIHFEWKMSTETSIFDKLNDLFLLKGDNERLLTLFLNKINDVEENSDDYLRFLNNIGVTYSNLGDYFNAEKYYIELIRNLEKRKVTQNTNFAFGLMNLGQLYSNIGDYEKAEEYLINTKNILIANNTLSYRPAIFTSIASVYKNQKKIKEEIELYNEAESYLSIINDYNKERRRNNPDNYASSLTSLGQLYYIMNEFKKSEDYYFEAKDIYEKLKGKEHHDYVARLSSLGNIYSNTGDYAKAEEHFLESITIQEKTIGKEHPYYTSSMNSLSFLYQKNSEFKKATKLVPAICYQTVEHINKNFSFLSEHQRNSYWATVEDIFENSYSLSFHSPEVATNELNFNNTLFTKGLLLRTNNQIRDAIYDSGDETLVQQFEQLGSLRKQINVLQSADSLDINNIKNLTNRADSLDKALTLSSTKFRELKADMAMSWQDVQKQLKSNEAAIEFVHFRLYDKKWTDTTMYAAMVLRPGMESPVWILLCEQKELQSALNMENDDTRLQTEMLYTGRGKELYQLIWGKLEKELPDVKTIYYSPSGLFHKIAINALPTDNENILLSDKYDTYLVSSTREIGRIKKDIITIAIQDTTTVFGGLLYDPRQVATLVDAKAKQTAAAKPAQAAAANPVKQSTSEYIGAKKYRNKSVLPNVDLRSAFSKWDYLPGSLAETEKIVKLLDNKQIPYQYYFENNGNEESFKNLSGTKSDIIHLSTHGFFLPDIKREDVEDVIRNLGGNREKLYENALLRSGLIMSGANEHWLAKERIVEDDIEDGILTADEISRLNLTKTKLVVLSACETGLGDVKNSEGVFGLQRAFKLAGVQSLIMSLWKVPDEPTAELMSTFYDEWLKGKSRHESFKSAQKKVREKYQSPYYWAAFVMMD